MSGSNPSPAVLKFGGSMFLDLDGYRSIAGQLAARVAGGGRAVVVVSAMSGTTGRLQETLLQVDPTPSPVASSMMLTTGDTVSVALLTAALNARGVAAEGLGGHCSGFIADGPADRARLCRVDPAPLVAALTRSRVVVLPGGQGVNADGRLVMLGRNSSDLSAVAAAVAVGAPACEIFSDVCGVYTADPHLVPDAHLLPRVDYDTMRVFAASGAKVVQGQAIEWAAAHGVRIVCRSLPPVPGETVVTATAPPVAAVLLHRRGELWAFGDDEARALAAARLRAEGLDALPLDGPQRLLVTTAHGRADLVAVCCESGTPLPDRCLLTVVAPGEVRHLVVARTDASGELRRQHERLYPPEPDAAHAIPFIGVGGKTRSTYSGLLLDGGGAGGGALPSSASSVGEG